MTHKVRIVVGPKGQIPTKAHDTDAGFDLYSAGEGLVEPGRVVAFDTDIRMHLGAGWEAQVRSRSGLAKYGIVVANSPGTIDANYTGPVKVLLANIGSKPMAFAQGDRIAQLVIQRVEDIEFDRVLLLDETDRGSNGFGSSGV